MNAKTTKQTATEAVEQIALKDIKPDPNQPRHFFDEKALQELADDIKVRGIMEPIIYFINNKKQKTILAGERRYRAAKLAKLKTVPCLLREANDPMERLMDQVSENFQREGLNPIEMATFFEQLVTKHEIKAKDLGSTLQKHGFKNFERSYISNIRRLLQLPEWAQQLIQEGKLTAAHGKHLLTASKSDKVMKSIKTFLKKQKTITTYELTGAIEDEYNEHHYDITAYYFHVNNQHHRVEFDTKEECKGCKTCQPIKGEYQDSTFCLNTNCFLSKQAEAVKVKEEAANKQNAKANNASKNSSTKTKTASASQLAQEQGRKERTQVYLDNWLRPQIEAHLIEDDKTRYQVVLWKASGVPGASIYYPQRDHLAAWERDPAGARIDTGDSIEYDSIDLTLKKQIDQKQLELMICHETIERIDRSSLRKLAHHCGIKLKGKYTIDRDYLEIKIKNELVDTVPDSVMQTMYEGDREKMRKRPAKEIIDTILERNTQYGVPADLIEMFNNTED